MTHPQQNKCCMKFVIALLIMILALSSCVEEKREQRKYMDILTININPHKKQVVHPFDSLFKKKNVVKLETTNESLIGRIDKLVLYEDNIYILDKKQKKTMAGLVLLMIVGAALQTAGVGMILPVVSLVLDQEALYEEGLLNDMFAFHAVKFFCN